MRCALPFLFILSAVVSGQAAASRQTALPIQATFEASLKSIHDTAGRGKWKAATEQLGDLLRLHELADYVYPHAAEIKALATSCAFALAYPDPDPKKLVSGELLTWDPQSGALKIRYKSSTMDDWVKGEILSHPVRFRGPHSIELKGAHYPSPKDEAMGVALWTSADNAEWVYFGASPENEGADQVWRPAKLIIREGGAKSDLDKKEHSPCRGGKPYQLKVRVTDSQVMVTREGGQVLLTGRRLKEYGRVGLEGPLPDEVTLEGKAESSWVLGLMDAAREKNRAEFQTKFKVEDAVPAWLSAPAPTVAATKLVCPWPDDMTTGQQRQALSVEKLLDQKAYAEGLATLEKLSDAELPELTRTFLLARFLEFTGRLAEAVPAYARVAAAAPTCWFAALGRGRALTLMGRPNEAIPLFKTLLAQVPQCPFVAHDAANASLMAGHIAEAKAIIDAAEARNVHSKELTHLRTVIEMGMEGPPWTKRYEYKSQNFIVTSDMDKSVCEQASKILEDSYLAYTTWLERVPGSSPQQFHVFLFGGEASYVKWTKDLTGDKGPENTWGLYSPKLKTLMIWNVPTREEMMRVVRHEGFHQYFDRIVPDSPTWLNEGLAQYFEAARLENGTWRPVMRWPAAMAVLAKTPTTDLKTFVFGTWHEFHANPKLHYPQAWAFVTFLKHTTPENKQLFDKLWSGLRENNGSYAVLTKLFPDREIIRLEREFEAWLQENK